jgi:hypothetical protein
MEEFIMSRANHPSFKLLAASVLGALALGSAATRADPPCTNASVSGTFYFTAAQIFVRPGDPGPDYCDEYGTAVADGAGNMRSTSMRRCSISSPTARRDTGRNTYRVNPDCSFTITEIRDDGTPGVTDHGKILMKGEMVLVDGTARAATDTSKLFHVVAVRTSKDKTLPATPAPVKK